MKKPKHFIRFIPMIALIFLLLSAFVVAQTPKTMSYQAVVRDAEGHLLANEAIGMQISILKGEAGGPAVFVERHSTSTNDNGLVTLVIGSGTIVSGSIETIEWGQGPFFMLTETDLQGGDNYTLFATTQLMSVPYAFYAGECETPGPPGDDGVGIDSVVDNEDGTFTLYLTDGTSFTTPELTGPQGEPGTTHWIDGDGMVSTMARVGIGVEDPGAFLHVYGDGPGEGNVLLEGVRDLTNPGETPASGSGTRLMWYPAKAAVRAGFVSGSHWDADSIGEHSVAFGHNTKATGRNSTAMGYTTEASGGYSTALGDRTTASGNYSTAMGNSTTASGTHATAMGVSTLAEDAGATAMGNNTIASGMVSTAMGYNTTASGRFSTAMGYNSTASGQYSTAMGYNSMATGNYSFAVNLSDDPAPDVGSRIFRVSGALEIGGNLPWTNHSDGRLKKDIQMLETEDNLEKIAGLRGIRFKWKSRPVSQNLGFIAQDVLEVVPEVVRYDELNDIYSLEYTSLIPVLVEGIKEQQKMITAQQERIAAQEKMLDMLLERIEILENQK